MTSRCRICRVGFPKREFAARGKKRKLPFLTCRSCRDLEGNLNVPKERKGKRPRHCPSFVDLRPKIGAFLAEDGFGTLELPPQSKAEQKKLGNFLSHFPDSGVTLRIQKETWKSVVAKPKSFKNATWCTCSRAVNKKCGHRKCGKCCSDASCRAHTRKKEKKNSLLTVRNKN